MSSVVDDDTARAINSGRETLGVGLRAAQKHLQKVFIAFVIGLVGTIWALRAFVWDFLKANTKSRMAAETAQQVDIIVRTPFDVILLQFKIGLLVGVLTALPVLLYYAREPLRERGFTSQVPIGRGTVGGIVLLSVGLFVGGVVYSFTVFFPFMFEFLAVNAIGAQIKPSYGIVLYTQFLLLLTVSFGLAAQLPLVMGALSYTEIVPYEFFRDKWRYAIVLIFVFGAVFSPPDPFTQIMWAVPLVTLYVFSLGLSKVLTNVRRRDAADETATGLRGQLLKLAGVTGLLWVGTVAFFQVGGLTVVNESVLPALPASVRPASSVTVGGLAPVGGSGLGGEVALGFVVAVVGTLLLGMAFTVKTLQEPVVPRDYATKQRYGDPTAIDLSELDEAGVRAAPVEAFVDLSEEEAVDLARQAMDEDDGERAQAILDRFDEAQELDEAEPGAADGTVESGESDDLPGEDHGIPDDAWENATPGGSPETDDEGNVVQSTAAGMLDAFTEEETTEDDVGGYYYDFRFILESLTSKMFRLVGVFMLVLAGTFFWLYQGGIGAIKQDFLSRIDPIVWQQAGLSPDNLGLVIALHPVEALIFEVKVSTIVAVLAILPLLLYYAWPALETRGIASGDRRVFGVWGLALFGGFAAGLFVGYTLVAPTIISYLVGDAIKAGMVISYRLKNFFWLIFLTTAGIGILFDIPVSMVLFDLGGIVSFESMYKRWRVVVIGIFALASVLTPSSVLTMLIVAIPVALFYLAGLGVLWAVTLPRRGWALKPD